MFRGHHRKKDTTEAPDSLTTDTAIWCTASSDLFTEDCAAGFCASAKAYKTSAATTIKINLLIRSFMIVPSYPLKEDFYCRKIS